MIANLKARAEGLDKKRVYTAVLALVVAGAAGHFMQRPAGGQSGAEPLTASVPGTPEAAQSAPVVAAAAFVPEIAPAGSLQDLPEPEPDLAEAAQPEPVSPELDAVRLAPVQQAALEDITVPEVQDFEIAQTAAPEIEVTEPAFDAPEVTRSASEPILAIPAAPQTSPAPDAETDLVLAEADELVDPATEPTPPIANCALAFDAAAQPGAMVALTFSAPCNAGEDVEFTHAGLNFSEQLGPMGGLFLEVPAMAQTATFEATLEDGQVAAAETTVPDFAAFERVALVWKGATGLQLHALEGGASYGEPGHVWAESPGKLQATRDGEGGFLSVLGSTASGYAADVYTYPAKLVADGVEPLVSVEAQVMENTCGTEIDGQILRTNAGRAPTAQALSMNVPGCDAVGEYLVLNNLPQDLKLARK